MRAWLLRHGSLVAAMCVAVPFAASSILHPFSRDQGIYAYAADQMLNGHVLYRDIYVFKPPVTVFVHAASLLLFGHHMWSIRVFDILWTLATIAVLHTFVVRSTGSRTWAFVTGVMWAYTYHHIDWWNSAQTDGWANLPIAGAFLLATPRDEDRALARPASHALAGVLLGVAFLFKYTIAVFAPWLVLMPVMLRGKRGLTDAAAMIVGGMVGAGLILGYLAGTGGFEQFIATQRDVTMPYSDLARALPLWGRLGLLAKRIGAFDAPGLVYGGATLPMLAWLCFRAPERRTQWRWFTATMALWTLGAVASGWVQKKMFPYHFLPFIAPMSVLAGGAAGRLADRFAAAPGRWWIAPLSGVLVTALLAALPPFSARWGIMERIALTDYTLEQRWIDVNQHSRDMSSVTCYRVADWLRANTEADDPVFLWGYDPIIYFLADRDLVSRFPYTYPLVVTFAPKALRDELIASLNANPPVVFGVSSHDATPVVTGHKKDSTQTFEEFARLNHFVRDQYVLVKEIDTWRLWMRKDRAVGRTPLPDVPPKAAPPKAAPPKKP